MNWKWCIFIAMVLFGGYQHFKRQSVEYDPGAIAPHSPIQTSANQPEFTYQGYTILPQQSFEIEARILASEQYHMDAGAELSPIDLALGWGPMSDEANLKQIKINQSNRFYYWQVEAFPIPREQIESNSANMHMIPSDEQVKATLLKAKVGQKIKIKGYLVNVRKKDFFWNSSLSRNDTGAGACELVFVESASLSR